MIFSALYDRVLRWSRHPHATGYLAALSFAESSFFPIPPDVMLAPMTLANRSRGWYLGGLAGYLIGSLALEAATPLLERTGYWEGYLRASTWFEDYGFVAVLAAGFSPVPYKVFTIAAGAMGMFLPGFALASLLGRGARFFLVAGLIIWGGEPMERQLRRHVDTLGWLFIALLVAGVLLLR
jgi:membrane protein YqaA with SNARE-associated domain